ncbi:hypothetical protein TSAR_005092 [Trichomalopsis sarcophagae]|uniref:Uncharacterized protein n=1 Tax=Trichomalopsis sarcophagae TaxID=543379 RepID=A0A232FLF3_9HYME|nr:hypothetical protein TSAR_005092 [Trichomalopsis sarcophagae]
MWEVSDLNAKEISKDHLPHFSQFNQNVKNGSLNLDAEKTLLFCELYTDKWLLKKPCNFPMTSSNTLGIGISSDELGYLIFHSTQTELYDENNIIFFLRLLWLQAKIFLYQGEADISIRTLELHLRLLSHVLAQFHQFNIT